MHNDSLKWVKSRFGEENFSRWTYDSLETEEDLDMLYSLIENYKKQYPSFPVITANFITHNVDYSYTDKLTFKPLTEGFNGDSQDVRNKYFYGIESGFIYPQLHGYSHYNLTEVLKYFNTEEGKQSFANRFFFCRSTIKKNLSFLQGELSKDNYGKGKLTEAANTFNLLFGFSSKSIIPPTFIFDEIYFEDIKNNGITMLQSSNRLIDSFKKKYRYPYFRKKRNVVCSIRNSRLDPYPGYDYNYEQCIASIQRAFDFKMPAIIDFHRVNISGRFAPEYRDRTLVQLRKLFDEIYRRWSDVKFINTETLNNILWQQ